MKNIRDELFQYLDAKQHLWNTCFVGRVVDLMQCEPLDTFVAIDKLLFKSLVCDELGITLPKDYVFGDDPVPQIKVRPAWPTSVLPVMVRDPPKDGNRSWNKEELFPGQGLGFEFIEFFQWDRYDYLSTSHVRCRIVQFPPNPEFVGREAIIENVNVGFWVEE